MKYLNVVNVVQNTRWALQAPWNSLMDVHCDKSLLLFQMSLVYCDLLIWNTLIAYFQLQCILTYSIDEIFMQYDLPNEHAFIFVNLKYAEFQKLVILNFTKKTFLRETYIYVTILNNSLFLTNLSYFNVMFVWRNSYT